MTIGLRGQENVELVIYMERVQKGKRLNNVGHCSTGVPQTWIACEAVAIVLQSVKTGRLFWSEEAAFHRCTS